MDPRKKLINGALLKSRFRGPLGPPRSVSLVFWIIKFKCQLGPREKSKRPKLRGLLIPRKKSLNIGKIYLKNPGLETP